MKKSLWYKLCKSKIVINGWRLGNIWLSSTSNQGNQGIANQRFKLLYSEPWAFSMMDSSADYFHIRICLWSQKAWGLSPSTILSRLYKLYIYHPQFPESQSRLGAGRARSLNTTGSGEWQGSVRVISLVSGHCRFPTAPYPGIQDERTSQGSTPSLGSSSFALRLFSFNFCGVSTDSGAQPPSHAPRRAQGQCLRCSKSHWRKVLCPLRGSASDNWGLPASSLYVEE